MEQQELLDKALGRLEAGESAAEVLEGQAEAEELWPLLGLAQEMRAVAPRQPNPAFRAAARCRLESAVARRRERLAVRLKRWVMPAAAAMLALAVVSTGTMRIVGASLPDSPVYPVKLAVEQVELVLSSSVTANQGAFIGYAERRLAELETLSGREGDFDQLSTAMERAAEATAPLPKTAQAKLWPRLATVAERQRKALAKGHDGAKGEATEAAERLLAVSETVLKQAAQHTSGPIAPNDESEQGKGVKGGAQGGSGTPPAANGGPNPGRQGGQETTGRSENTKDKDPADKDQGSAPKPDRQVAPEQDQQQIEGSARDEGKSSTGGRDKGQRPGKVVAQHGPGSGRIDNGKGRDGQVDSGGRTR